MKKTEFVRISFIVLMIMTALVVTALASGADARKIVEAVYNQYSSRDASWRAVMAVYDKKGTAREKRFLFRRAGSLGNSKTLVRFIEPAEVRGVGLLSYNHK